MLVVVSTSMFVIIFDNGAMNVAFPFIEQTFPSTSRSVLAWVSTGYSIVLAALLVVGGRLADGRGRKRVFLAGMAIFSAASVLTAVAPTPGLLIAARLVQGVGGAFLFATAVAMILPEFPPERRGLALGIWGCAGSLAAALGPTLGALAIEWRGWRWVFTANIVLGVVVLAVGPKVLRESRDTRASARIDGPGTALGAMAIALLTLGVLQGPGWGWSDPRVVASLTGAAGGLVLFVRRCARVPDPAIRLGLFRNRNYTTANLSQMGTQSAVFAWLFATPLFMINVWGFSALRAGFAVAVAMVASLVSVVVGRYADRHGFRRVLVSGGLVAASGALVWAVTLGEEPRFWGSFTAGLVVFGIGAGMVGVASTSAALDTVAEDELAVANAVHQTLRRVAQGLGVAMVVALLGDRATDSVPAFRRVWVAVAVGYGLSAAAGFAYRDRLRVASVPSPTSTPASPGEALGGPTPGSVPAG